MSSKNCPFCKKIVSTSDATCPHCTRVLFEKIYDEQAHKSPSHESKHPNESAKAQKISISDKLKKFFSKFAFWKTSSVHHKSGKDKFKKIGIAIVVVIFLFGFFFAVTISQSHFKILDSSEKTNHDTIFKLSSLLAMSSQKM